MVFLNFFNKIYKIKIIIIFPAFTRLIIKYFLQDLHRYNFIYFNILLFLPTHILIICFFFSKIFKS